jgi:16S rRNA (uracil1498-N3)-methyltransferase
MVKSLQTAEDASASDGRAEAVGRHVPHLCVPGPWEGALLQIDDAARTHLDKVLRFSAAAPVTYTDGAGLVGTGMYEAGLIERGGEEVEPVRPAAVTIAVAPPRSADRVRFIVEKLAELGVDRLVWLQTEHTEGRLPRAGKVGAWAKASLEQSRGAWMMQVEESNDIAGLVQYGTLVWADHNGVSIDDVGPIDNTVLCVGPEGGFAPAEIPADVPRVRLSRRVLRVETAAVAGAVLLIDRSSRGSATPR